MAGHIVRDRATADGIEYEVEIDGHTYIGRGEDDPSAVRALFATCGWESG